MSKPKPPTQIEEARTAMPSDPSPWTDETNLLVWKGESKPQVSETSPKNKSITEKSAPTDGNKIPDLLHKNLVRPIVFDADGNTTHRERFDKKRLGEIIDHLKQINKPSLESSWLRELDRYASDHTGEEVAKRVRATLPDLIKSVVSQYVENTSSNTLSSQPSSAPEKWESRADAAEKPPLFIKRVYGKWLGHGLDRATVRRLDPSLGQALDNWLRKNDMPPDIDLPTAKERSAREIAALRSGAGEKGIGEILGGFTAREASRIRSNIARHEGRKK